MNDATQTAGTQPRLGATTHEIRGSAQGAARTRQRHTGSRRSSRSCEHGCGVRRPATELIDGAVRDLHHHHRPEAAGDPGTQVHRAVQVARGQPIGAHTTLRGDRMWEFLDRLMSVALPRIRDFGSVATAVLTAAATTASD